MIIIDDDGVMHKVLPIETLDKIRAEIEFEVDHRTNMLCAEDIFEIIDRYRNEVKK